MGSSVAVLSLVLFSSNVLLTKAASTRLNVNVGYFVSICMNVLVALLLAIGEHLLFHHPFAFNGRAFFEFIVAGSLTTFVGRLTYFFAIERLGAARASTIQVASPVFTVVLAWLFLSEELSFLKTLGCLLTIVGLLIITIRRDRVPPKRFSQAPRSSIQSPDAGAAVSSARSTAANPPMAIRGQWPGIAATVQPSTVVADATVPGESPVADSNSHQRGRGRRILSLVPGGVLLALLSMSAYGAGNLVRGDAVRGWNDPIVGGLIGASVGFIAFVGTHPRQIAALADIRQADRKAVWMYALGGVCTILAQISVLFAMRYLPIGVVTVVSMAQPLLVIPLGYFLLRDADGITWRTVAGSALTLAGLIFAVGL